MTELIQTLFVALRRRSDQQRYVRFVLFLLIMTGINQAIQHPQRQFMWDDKSQEIIDEWKEYYDKIKKMFNFS